MKKKIAFIFTTIMIASSINIAYAQNQSVFEKNNDIILQVVNYYIQNNTSDKKEAEVSEKDKLINEYCSIKSEKEAIDIDEDILKSNYNLKKISWKDYSEQLTKFKTEENALELKEDGIELQLKKIRITELEKKAAGNAKSKTTEEINNLKIELNKLDLKDNENDLKKDNLKYQYKASQITRDAFIKEMKNLQKIEYDIEIQKDNLKYQLGYEYDYNKDFHYNEDFHYEKEKIDSNANITGTGDLNSLLSQLREIEIKKDELDLKEDKIELQYKKGEITFESYKQQKLQLEAEEDKLDNLEDSIENKLEMMGYDD